MIKYTDEFVKKVMDLYPDWEDLHFQLKQNSKMVGRYLGDAMGFSLDEDQIISLFRNKKEHKILEAAKRAQAKRNLYREWVDMMDRQADEQSAKHGYDL